MLQITIPRSSRLSSSVQEGPETIGFTKSGEVDHFPIPSSDTPSVRKTSKIREGGPSLCVVKQNVRESFLICIPVQIYVPSDSLHQSRPVDEGSLMRLLLCRNHMSVVMDVLIIPSTMYLKFTPFRILVDTLYRKTSLYYEQFYVIR